jgi:hypothetical protein
METAMKKTRNDDAILIEAPAPVLSVITSIMISQYLIIDITVIIDALIILSSNNILIILSSNNSAMYL